MAQLSRIKTISKRFRSIVLATAFVATQLVVPLSASDIFGASVAAETKDKVRICHRTNSTTNPYTNNEVSFDSTTGDLKDNGNSDHTSHTGPVWDANTNYPTPHNGDQWGDIIPPYTWDEGGSYAGLNWDAAGQIIWNNGCAPVEDETETVTPTAPTATTPNCEVSSMTVTPSTQDGVVWSPLLTTVLQPGESITYTASAATNYTFPDGAQTEWTFENTFDISTCEHVSTNGSITIKKNAIPDSSQGFNFTVTGAGLDDFSLTDDSTLGLPSKTFSDLEAGTYTITEAPTDGWYLSGIVCSKDGAVVSKSTKNGKVTITLDGSEQNVSCTFTNKKYKMVTLCHATGSLSNPYEEITINVAGAFNGHLDDDFGGTHGDHQNGEDIIPPFTYKGQTYSQNYDELGQAILDAHCVVTPPQENEVTPVAPTFVAPTCESNGTYTIPAAEGVQYKVNGVVTEAGTYPAVTGTSVKITAEATEGFVLKEGADASWNFDFDIEGGCVLGSNDVCPNLIGTQTSVPNGYTKNKAGNCVKPGHVLGASTELPNTGANALFNVIVGLSLITVAVGARFAGSRLTTQN